MTVPVPDEVHRALEDRARAVGITVEAYAADVLTRVVQPDPLEAFIGIGASGRTDALDMRDSRRELAARKLAEGLSSL
jgi:plasmid stability protein